MTNNDKKCIKSPEIEFFDSSELSDSNKSLTFNNSIETEKKYLPKVAREPDKTQIINLKLSEFLYEEGSLDYYYKENLYMMRRCDNSYKPLSEMHYKMVTDIFNHEMAVIAEKRELYFLSFHNSI